MLMSDSHRCWAVTTTTSRIQPFPHTGRTSRQTRRPHYRGRSLNYFQHAKAAVERSREHQDEKRAQRRAKKGLEKKTKQGGEEVMLSIPYDLHSLVSRFYPKLHLEDSRSRSRRDDRARKEKGIKDKARWTVSHVACVLRRGISSMTAYLDRLLRPLAVRWSLFFPRALHRDFSNLGYWEAGKENKSMPAHMRTRMIMIMLRYTYLWRRKGWSPRGCDSDPHNVCVMTFDTGEGYPPSSTLSPALKMRSASEVDQVWRQHLCIVITPKYPVTALALIRFRAHTRYSRR
ncbi:hypothetical protein PoB_004501400 [Plakobranchus ocellatus]|uniref:Uncharacterized protein n=1 Tax=Plakobranchus ocellatus TaxID=259542 RepID=A0AAV4BJL1_9GAST|nr:hypothetical protein PoB_004501400 [Plakobranchus ocellatus]